MPRFTYMVGDVKVDDAVAGNETQFDRRWAGLAQVFGTGFSYGAIGQGRIHTQTEVFIGDAPEQGIYDVRAGFCLRDWHIGHTHLFGLPWENPDAYDDGSGITEGKRRRDFPSSDRRRPSLTASTDPVRTVLRESEPRGNSEKVVVYYDEIHTIGNTERAVHLFEQFDDLFEVHDLGLNRDAPIATWWDNHGREKCVNSKVF